MIDFVINFDKENFCKYRKYIIDIFYGGILKKSKKFIILIKLKLGFSFEHFNCMRDKVSDNIQTSFNL